MGNDKTKLYINGELEASGAHPDQSVDEGGAPLWIGESDASRGFAWNGIIDEVGIWSRSLSQDEISLAMEGKGKMVSVKLQGKLTTTWGEMKKHYLFIFLRRVVRLMPSISAALTWFLSVR